VALFGASALAASSAGAQVTLQLGVVASTALVRDSFVEAFPVRANPALVAGLSAEAHVDRYRVGVSLNVSRSDLMRRESISTSPVTRLTIWHPAVYLRQPLRPWLSGEARLGLVIYHPSVRSGTLFRNGAPVQPALGVGLRVERRVGRGVAVGIAGQYDLHRFSTPALRTEGFTGDTFVHRVTFSLGVRRVPADERAPR
jgi:hypothetical protein